jgi:hypothetical protein
MSPPMGKGPEPEVSAYGIFDLSARRLGKQFSVRKGPEGSGRVGLGPDFWLAVPE